MGQRWRDCIVTVIDMVGVKKRARDGNASTAMRRLHALVTREMGALQSVAHAYVWNDSVLLLSYVNEGDASFQSAIRDAEKLKRRIDDLAGSYAIAVKGRAFPLTQGGHSPARTSRVTVIEASSWAMANCFEVEKALATKWRKPWYIDIRIARKIRTCQSFHADTVKLLPTGRARRVHVFDGYLWDAPATRRNTPPPSGADTNKGAP
jgi:hypothetical protein